MTDYVLPPAYTFTAGIETPDGVRADVTFTLPAALDYKDVLEGNEFAQAGAVRVVSMWRATMEHEARRQARLAGQDES